MYYCIISIGCCNLSRLLRDRLRYLQRQLSTTATDNIIINSHNHNHNTYNDNYCNGIIGIVISLTVDTLLLVVNSKTSLCHYILIGTRQGIAEYTIASD